MRYRLRTLLILLAILPPLLAVVWLRWQRSRTADYAPADDPYEVIWDDYAPDTIPPPKQ